MKIEGQAQLSPTEIREADETIAALKTPDLKGLKRETLLRLAEDVEKLDEKRRDDLYHELLERGLIDPKLVREIENCRDKAAKAELIVQAIVKSLDRAANNLKQPEPAAAETLQLSALGGEARGRDTNDSIESRSSGSSVEYSRLESEDYDKKEIAAVALAVLEIAESERLERDKKKEKAELEESDRKEELRKSIEDMKRRFPEIRDALERLANLPETPFESYISLVEAQTMLGSQRT